MEHAAMNWTSGKPAPPPQHLPLTHAKSPAPTPAPAHFAATATIATMAYATKTAAISTPTASAHNNFYGPSQKVDTTSNFTVATQFLTNSNKATGVLS